MKTFRLYGTSGCHLCEEAADLLNTQLPLVESAEYQQVDISDSDALFERYGLLIPVLQHPDGREMHWPFSPPSLLAFLRS